MSGQADQASDDVPSGARSIDAAIAATEAGYGRAYNILEGFEGEKDVNGHG